MNNINASSSQNFSNPSEQIVFSASITSEWINRVILVFYFALGLLGNGLNILIFSRAALIRASTSIYLLAASASNLVVILLVIPYRLLADGYDLDPTSISLLACRLISYFNHVFLAIPPYFNILACADRWAATSVEVHRRRFAQRDQAKRLLIIPLVLALFLYSYILLTFSCEYAPPPPYCSIDETYAFFGLSFYLLIYTIIPPGLMLLFSCGIIYNIYQKQDRIAPTLRVISLSQVHHQRIRRSQRHLSPMQMMLICQAFLEGLCTLPFSVINFIALIVTNNESFLSTYAYVRLLIFFNYASSFYIYTLSSKLYRKQFRSLVKEFCHRRPRHHPRQ